MMNKVLLMAAVMVAACASLAEDGSLDEELRKVLIGSGLVIDTPGGAAAELRIVEQICNFDTNRIGGLVLLSTAWAFGGDYYLQCLSNNLELVDAGVLSKQEFLWARRASRSVSLLGLIPLNYNRPGVSNLVLRMQQVIGDTNYCQRILSGAARVDVINYMDSLSDPSNEQ